MKFMLSDENLKSIIEKLDTESPNSGLYYGKTGLLLACSILVKTCNDKFYVNKSVKLIDDLSENISEVTTFDFETGLSGIGWGLEWLVENEYLEVNTDEALEEIDDFIYKSVVFSKDTDLSLRTGIIGKAMYFLKRLNSKNPNSSRFRKVCLKECLFLLIQEITESVNYESLMNNNLPIEKIIDTSVFLLKIRNTVFGTPNVKKSLKEIKAYLDKYVLVSRASQKDAIQWSCHFIYAYYQLEMHINNSGKFYSLMNSYAEINKLNLNSSFPFNAYIAGKINIVSCPPISFEYNNEQIVYDNIGSLLSYITINIAGTPSSWDEGWGL